MLHVPVRNPKLGPVTRALDVIGDRGMERGIIERRLYAASGAAQKSAR